MHSNDVLHVLDSSSWNGPFSESERVNAIDALESGRVVCLPRLPFQLQDSDKKFLSSHALDQSRKNVSFDHRTGRCRGTGFEGGELTELASMLDRFGRSAETLTLALFPNYAATLERARTSFRPAEIKGRVYSPRHDDRRLHVDAFPSRPLRGRRILRVFANVAPEGVQREWRVGERFDSFAAAFLPRVKPAMSLRFWAMSLLGVTKGRRSAYDHIMLSLHDAAKLDLQYQRESDQAAVNFAPGTTWICFTDQVLHAAMAGRCAMEQTFHLPVEAMAHPERTPLRVLERLAGRALV